MTTDDRISRQITPPISLISVFIGSIYFLLKLLLALLDHVTISTQIWFFLMSRDTDSPFWLADWSVSLLWLADWTVSPTWLVEVSWRVWCYYQLMSISGYTGQWNLGNGSEVTCCCSSQFLDRIVCPNHVSHVFYSSWFCRSVNSKISCSFQRVFCPEI